jgi:hypothetical protein
MLRPRSTWVTPPTVFELGVSAAEIASSAHVLSGDPFFDALRPIGENRLQGEAVAKQIPKQKGRSSQLYSTPINSETVSTFEQIDGGGFGRLDHVYNLHSQEPTKSNMPLVR